MSQQPVDDLTARQYEAPRVTQFSVFLDNRVGKLLELLEVFEGQAVRLVALSVVDAADHAVVRLVTSNAEVARKLLRQHELPFAEVDVLVVELGRRQTLSSVCQSLLQAELNIHYAFPLLPRAQGQSAALALFADDQSTAGQILLRKHFTLLGEADLQDESQG